MAIDPDIHARQLRVVGAEPPLEQLRPRELRGMKTETLIAWKARFEAELKRRADEIAAALRGAP